MRPVREILSRIRWDPEFGAAEFRIGYLDRVEDRILEIRLPEGDPPRVSERGMLEITDAAGFRVSVPLHRIRWIRRSGRIVWSR